TIGVFSAANTSLPAWGWYPPEYRGAPKSLPTLNSPCTGQTYNGPPGLVTLGGATSCCRVICAVTLLTGAAVFEEGPRVESPESDGPTAPPASTVLAPESARPPTPVADVPTADTGWTAIGAWCTPPIWPHALPSRASAAIATRARAPRAGERPVAGCRVIRRPICLSSGQNAPARKYETKREDCGPRGTPSRDQSRPNVVNLETGEHPISAPAHAPPGAPAVARFA